MIASASSHASAARAALTLGTMPPLMVPSAMSASASATVIESSLRPDASRTPSTSVMSTSWRAPRPAAIPAAASSAFTLHTTPSSSRASGATTGTWSATSRLSRRSRRMPVTCATSPTSGIRWPMSRPPSTPDRPTASQPTSRSAATSSEFTTPAQDGRGHLERGRVGDPQAALEPGRHAEALEPLGHPLAAAMDEHDGALRATAATSARTCFWSASVVPPSLTTTISLTTCTPSSRGRSPR